ncbi:MAG TPA: sigma-54 dependent transcriptional regulator [Candidatus Deferrimicrobium sp.]|nr:sigma-54 dependent transcriptional regulator [Candidatus Deferrimicrobium sp.]
MTTPNNPIILLVDDDPQVLASLTALFSGDYETLTATIGKEAVQQVRQRPDICAVVMDIKMAGMDGLSATREISQFASDLPIILHTGYPGEYDEYEIDQTSKPFDYIEKGDSSLKLIRSVRNAVESYRLKKDVAGLSNFAEQAFGLIGRSKAMLDVYHRIREVAPTDIKVMILGETGTGKELVARAIHQASQRRDKRLAIFNCNHKSSDLVESELFGHRKGAFTTAIVEGIGLFEYGDGGTVFLDEIGDLDITTQAKVLRALETGEYQRIGEPNVRRTDVRLLCATHRDLEMLVSEGKFRQDLFYRLKGVQIVLPALRDHKEDIPLLVERFINRFTIERDMPPRLIDSTALRVLIDYDWPGNVRQLLDTIESLVCISHSHVITSTDIERHLGLAASDLPCSFAGNPLPLSRRLREFRRNCIIEALAEARNNISEAARILGVDRSNLRRDIQEFDIPLG